MAIPWSVLDSEAYRTLSHAAKALLLEVARQYHGDDNGRMLLSAKHLAPRGWGSPDVIQRAKRDLLEAELIFETVKGHRPNKASWYAVTWQSLDKLDGYDVGVERAFRRGAYRDVKGVEVARKNAPLTTPYVVGMGQIATPPVAGSPLSTTGGGAMAPMVEVSSTTFPVHPLEMPSGEGCSTLDPVVLLARSPSEVHREAVEAA